MFIQIFYVLLYKPGYLVNLQLLSSAFLLQCRCVGLYPTALFKKHTSADISLSHVSSYYLGIQCNNTVLV